MYTRSPLDKNICKRNIRHTFTNIHVNNNLKFTMAIVLGKIKSIFNTIKAYEQKLRERDMSREKHFIC